MNSFDINNSYLLFLCRFVSVSKLIATINNNQLLIVDYLPSIIFSLIKGFSSPFFLLLTCHYIIKDSILYF
jgi:hypothetical protein